MAIDWDGQQQRNQEILVNSRYMRDEVVSRAIRPSIDIDSDDRLGRDQINLLLGLQKQAARTALSSLASLAKINELDHLGGGLELIPSLCLTLATSASDSRTYTIEHAHTSIGYYSALAAYGFLDEDVVIEGFRRGLDIAGHVSWVPGGTEMNGGRLGVMIPVAVGNSLGLRAHHGDDAWTVCHCGDAGYISGQALNGFNGADLHGAPITFVMHRNGIQLSGATHTIMDKDPRPILEGIGLDILEVPTLMEPGALFQAYREGRERAKRGRPSVILPVGYRSGDEGTVTLHTFAQQHGIEDITASFAADRDVSMETDIWIPGSLMSYRDVIPMLECLFLVNDLPGGAAHHDGHMKGRDLEAVLANPMLQLTAEEQQAVDAAFADNCEEVVTRARPAVGTPNLTVDDEAWSKIDLPNPGDVDSPRSGASKAYEVIAEHHADRFFLVSCDLDVSTKLNAAKAKLAADHQFEMSIEEQAASLLTDGLSMSSRDPQLNVFSTFGAFFEGIAREGFEMWRYQRNLNGINEGLNVTFHVSHVGACTGRDHFSGWALDWINLGLGYLPYLHRFYTPADTRAALLAVKDLAAHRGGHIIGIPRDKLPVLSRQDSDAPLWETTADWDPVTAYRTYPNASRAIVAVGATAFLAGEAADALAENGTPVDVHVVNGFPLAEGWLDEQLGRYPEGMVTIEDGIIGSFSDGLRGFAGLVRAAAQGRPLPLRHLGIVDPRIAPSEGFEETWSHFGLTAEALQKAVESL